MLKRMVSGLAPGWVTFENVNFETLEIFSQLQTLIDFFSCFQWIGFLISFTFCWILSAVMFFGQSHLLGEQEEQEQDSTEPATEGSITEHLKKLPTQVKKLLTNVTYVLIVIFLAMDDGIITSLATFMPKYAESQYQITPSTSALLVGGLTVVTACLGKPF